MDQGRDKRITLIVDSEPHRYQIFCSDISGQDIRVHKKDPVEVIKVVRNWLRASRPDIEIPGGTMIAKRYKEFTEHKKIIPLGSQRQLPALRASSRRWLGYLARFVKITGTAAAPQVPLSSKSHF